MGCDFVLATDFLSEMFISDDVVVFSVGNWGVVRFFFVVVDCFPTKGFVVAAVGGFFSSAGSAADDVRAFIVMGWDDVIKSAIWDEDKIRADITMFTSLKGVDIRVWDDVKSFIDLDDVIILVIRDDVIVFSTEEVWDNDNVISLLTCDDDMASVICHGELIGDDVMVFFGCSDVISSKCLGSVEVLTGVDLMTSDEVSNCDDVINFVRDGDVISSNCCDERLRTIKGSTAVDMRDVDNCDGVIVSVGWGVAMSSMCRDEWSSFEGLEEAFIDAGSRAPDDVTVFTNWDDVIIVLGSEVIFFNPSDDGSIFMGVAACTVFKDISSFSSRDDVSIEGDVTNLDDVISSWVS